jgi:hypothetical protein
MKKQHELKSVIVNHIEIKFFYIREKNDRNGNARYRVYISDPDGPAVYEEIAKTYESLLPEWVQRFVNRGCQ